MSIIECVIFDQLLRIQEHTKEKIDNLEQNSINCIKNIDLPNKLRSYTDISKKHSLFGDENEIYEKIIRLIDYRNRVHIQNFKKYEPINEKDLWSLELIKEAWNTMEKVIVYCARNYPRKSQNNLTFELPFPSNEV